MNEQMNQTQLSFALDFINSLTVNIWLFFYGTSVLVRRHRCQWINKLLQTFTTKEKEKKFVNSKIQFIYLFSFLSQSYKHSAIKF